MELEKLYKRTKTGAIQVCRIYVVGGTYSVEFGQLDGKLQTQDTKCLPVNVGKSNETTAEEQAVSEAKSKWASKVKSGYSTDVAAPVTVQLPQKVKVFLENKDKIAYPAYSVTKLNGINGTYWLMPDNSLKLTSRGGDSYPPIPHLEPQVRADMQLAGTTCINCELYIHGEHLQDINSAVKKTKALSSRLTFNPFELPLVDTQYKDKVDTLRMLSGEAEIVEVANEEEATAHFNDCIAKGYEGTVLYNKTARYAFNERSSDVYKYKIPKEAEFRIIDHVIDKKGHAVYVCKLTTDKWVAGAATFKVKRKGTNEERQADAAVAFYNNGKWLTVEFEMLSKDGVPLKPVGLDYRLCNDAGEPLE